MTDAKIFVEGGGNDNNALIIRCRTGFKKLLEGCGLVGRLPKIIPCGSRNDAYNDFRTEHLAGVTSYVALLIDSEIPVIDGDKPWEHLKKSSDNWDCPKGATDDQVFLMTTCMETWIIADKDGLKRHYEHHQRCLRPARLPSTVNLETTDRHQVQDALMTATQDCTNAYAKNKRSFEALANVDPAVLRQLLPAFARMERILKGKL